MWFRAGVGVLILVLLPIGTISVASAAVIKVPGDEPSITAAVKSAAAADTILLAAGSYSRATTGEQIPIIIEKPLVIMSEGDPAECILTPDDTGRGGRERELGFFIVRNIREGRFVFQGLTFKSSESRNRFTIGIPSAGMDIYRAKALVDGCRFLQMETGIRVGSDTSVRVQNCYVEDALLGITAGHGLMEIEGNELVHCKKGISLNYTQASIVGNRVLESTADAMAISHSDSCVVKDNYIEGSAQCGIALRWSGPEISGNQLSKNNFSIWCSDGSNPHITNNVIRLSRGYDVGCERGSSPIVGGGLAGANDFTGEGIYFIRNLTEAPVDCRWNYWGTRCPSAEHFEGPVKFSPWTDPDHNEELTECP